MFAAFAAQVHRSQKLPSAEKVEVVLGEEREIFIFERQYLKN